MRVVVRIADRDVDQRGSLFLEETHQLDGLGQVGFGRILAVHAEAVGIGHGVVNVHARGHDQAGDGVANFAHDVTEKARAVLE